LGVNDYSPHSVPTKVGTSTSWTSVNAGGNHTCARHNSGSLYCWGLNDNGQLGLNDYTERIQPAKVG
ncbi:MAG: hypothetical protein ABIN55_04610, partial [Aeromicrobium sp.]